MRLSNLSVRNFRNFQSVDIPLCGNVVLLGENRVGKSNLLLGIRLVLDPTLPDSALAPLPVNEGGYLTITITKHAGATYEVQSAGTLLPAQTDFFTPATTTVLLDNTTTLKVRDNFFIGATPARFLRVKVTAAP